MKVAASVLILAASGAQAAVPPVAYRCGDGTRLVATFTGTPTAPGSVSLKFQKLRKPIVLPQAVSANGGRYASSSMEFWDTGKSATLTRSGKSTTCRTQR